MQVWDAPRGRGPYGIATTPDGDVYYASPAGSHIARVDLETGAATVIEPPTKDQGARRVWSDSRGRIWVSEWNSGQRQPLRPEDRRVEDVEAAGRQAADVLRLRRRSGQGVADRLDRERRCSFRSRDREVRGLSSDKRGANVRQMLGRPGEVWAPESGTDRLVVFRRK